MSADVPARDRLDAIAERVAACQERRDESPYSAPVATLWYAEDVPVLVNVARAARETDKWNPQTGRGLDGLHTQHRAAVVALRAALGRLDGLDKEQP